MRLDKFLAESGVGSRKECRLYIKDRLVKVNGIVTTEPALDIDEIKDIIIYVNDRIYSREKVYYMFNKPKGCITARSDNESKTVFDYFKNENMDGVTHVGRLDKDTEGLLLLTNDGDFNHKLMNPEKHIDKKYYFIALGQISQEDKNKIEGGMSIGEHDSITKEAELEIIKSGDYKDLEEELDLKRHYKINKGYYSQPIVSGYLTLVEGKKHQVKRMIKAVGCYVIYLKRISIGSLKLDDSLKCGEYRKLTKKEIMNLVKKQKHFTN